MKLIWMLIVSILLSGTLAYTLGNVLAATLGVGEEAWVEPQRELRGTFNGVLEFDKAPDGFCNIDIPIKHGPVGKMDLTDISENADYLFVRVDNKDSQESWQLQIGYPADDLSYDIHLKTGNDQLGGALYSPDSNSPYSYFGVILEPNENAKIASEAFDSHLELPEYSKFLESLGGDTYLTFGLPMEKRDYALEAVVFDSTNDWISSDVCAIKVVIPISVAENGTAQVGTIQLSNVKVSDITEDLSPRQQHQLGVGGSNIECAPGLRLVEKATNNEPACVEPETKEKLIERGWAKPSV